MRRLSLEYAVASNRRPAPIGTSLRTLILQPSSDAYTLWVTLKAAYMGRATEQCRLTPTPSACTALSLEQAPTGSKQCPGTTERSVALWSGQ